MKKTSKTAKKSNRSANVVFDLNARPGCVYGLLFSHEEIKELGLESYNLNFPPVSQEAIDLIRAYDKESFPAESKPGLFIPIDSKIELPAKQANAILNKATEENKMPEKVFLEIADEVIKSKSFFDNLKKAVEKRILQKQNA